ncbi:alpha/beta fold hydrolase [Antarcticimicrobium sediminis]|uniref:Alpha/beta hydrolase n=1 Tax=Antarcticimicrobium sediminis TaxID=2546227 RepID=A0A4R5ENB7_9RHOB|nr:alpha/beta hydrolase [Antarcticimicrobium sediminis]TDE36067.1 alpha/beta hydrolase [Antarcticimicrobium sediminis]
MVALDWSEVPKTPLVVDGVTLEYSCFGPPPQQAPTIVMLHEGLGCAALWRDFPARVAARTGMGVLVYSRQGYGQSDPAKLPRPLDFMTREAVDVLPHVLDQAGIARCILFGHSDGATIAAIYAGSVEDFRVRGLILMAPHFFTEEMGLKEIAKAREVFARTDMKERMAKYHKDPENAFRGWNDTWLDPGFKAWNVGEVIDYLRIPVLAIQGRDDQYGTLAQIEEIESRSYAPVDTVILEDCKHAPHQEQSEQTLDAVAEFTARLERIEAAEVVPS